MFCSCHNRPRSVFGWIATFLATFGAMLLAGYLAHVI